MMIPYPYGLTWEEWSNLIVEAYVEEGMPEWRPMEADWKEWAERISEVDTIDTPTPEDFPDWRSWADRVVGLLYD